MNQSNVRIDTRHAILLNAMFVNLFSIRLYPKLICNEMSLKCSHGADRVDCTPI